MKRVVLAVLVLAGCPSARAPGAECGEGAVVLEGACVSYRVADAFCGKTAKPAGGACARTACGPGEALDVEHGFCLPESTVFLGVNHAPPAFDEAKRRATCAHGWLASRGVMFTCAFGKLSCGRGERWAKDASADAGPKEWAGKCVAQAPCGVGEIFDEATEKCSKILRNGVVDVGSWARLVIGPDTAEGTNAFCAPVRLTGAPSRFQIDITLPDNDVTRASARLVPKGAVAANATDVAEHTLEELVETLHFQGKTAMAASVSLEVACTPPPTAPPALENVETRDGGRE
ncbi:MAG TPA: hypothetical protein VGH87_24490 [Polyangiaceae bacterium]|jgi:hypothetical protein